MKTRTKVMCGALFAVLVMTMPLAADARPGGHGGGYGHGYMQGHGYGGGYGPGWDQSLPQEKRDAVRAMMREHWEKMQPIRDQLWIKSRTLDALEGNPKVEPKEISALVAEMAALKDQLRAEHKTFADRMQKETGLDYPFDSCGMGDGWRGKHRGPGRHGGHNGGMGHW